jgi:hypothetical protein
MFNPYRVHFDVCLINLTSWTCLRNFVSFDLKNVIIIGLHFTVFLFKVLHMLEHMELNLNILSPILILLSYYVIELVCVVTPCSFVDS